MCFSFIRASIQNINYILEASERKERPWCTLRGRKPALDLNDLGPQGKQGRQCWYQLLSKLAALNVSIHLKYMLHCLNN